MKQILMPLLILSLGCSLYGQTQEWYINFRDAVYGQNLSTSRGETLFREAERQARASLTCAALNNMLSRCEYLRGKVYQDNNQNDTAVTHYERGIFFAEESLKFGETAEAYEMIAANYGQLCMIKSRAWVMANGLKVLNNARKAIQLDSRNASAHYLLASQHAFAPGVLGNPRRGVTELNAILDGNAIRHKDDNFNIYSALGFAYLRLDQYQDALLWTQRAIEIYPTNKFVLNQQLEIQQKMGAAR